MKDKYFYNKLHWKKYMICYLFQFICSFLLSDVETKRGVEFHHSKINASRIRLKMENGETFLTLGFLSPPGTLMCAGYIVKVKNNTNNFYVNDILQDSPSQFHTWWLMNQCIISRIFIVHTSQAWSSLSLRSLFCLRPKR